MLEARAMDHPADKLHEIRKQIQARQRDLVELEARAGVAEAAEKLRTDLPHYELIYDAAERFSDQQREFERQEEQRHRERTTRRMRDLYFSVRELGLRKALIAKEREIGTLDVHYWRQELDNAAGRLTTAKSAHQNWWVFGALWGALFIGLGFVSFNWVGALAGLLVGYLWAREWERRALSSRKTEIEEADREFREAEQAWDEVRNEPLIFSQREARTGEPDPT
jgi:hypothetical protein